MPSREYGFDPNTLEYFQQVGGRRREIQAGAIKQDVNRFARGVEKEMREITQRFINGQITSQQWYDESARMMKLSYRAAVDVARGSHDEMDDSDTEEWLALAILLLLLLNRTAEALEAGARPSEKLLTIPGALGPRGGVLRPGGRLLSIAGLKGAAIMSIYENRRLAEALRAGYTETRRVLGVAEHCDRSKDRPGCVELAARGWIPIWQMIPIGGATCRSNCKCHLEFRGRSIFTGG